MKRLQLFLSSAFLILPFSLVFCQNNKAPSFDFFAKKNSSYTLRETGYYGRMNNFDNGVKRGHSNSTWVNGDWNHWFGGGLGAGLDVYANWSGYHYNGEQLTRYWTITPSLSYGKMLNDNWGIYGRAGLTFGIDKYESTIGIIHTEDKSDLFGFGGSVGFPYKISKYTALTTELQYNHLTTDFDDGKTKDNSYGVNLHLEDYLGCSQMHCDPSGGFKLSQHKYDQGHGLVNYNTRASLMFGDTRTTYNGSPTINKNNNTDADIDLNAMYYIINYVALGGGIDFGHSSQKTSGSGYRSTSTFYDFNPELNVNLPVDNGLRNLFFKGGGYFGSDKSVIKTGNNTFTDKFSTTGFNAGIGYNAFFADETALRACVYYRSMTSKNKDTDDKSKQEGIAVSVGLTHFF